MLPLRSARSRTAATPRFLPSSWKGTGESTREQGFMVEGLQQQSAVGFSGCTYSIVSKNLHRQISFSKARAVLQSTRTLIHSPNRSSETDLTPYR